MGPFAFVGRLGKPQRVGNPLTECAIPNRAQVANLPHLVKMIHYPIPSKVDDLLMNVIL